MPYNTFETQRVPKHARTKRRQCSLVFEVLLGGCKVRSVMKWAQTLLMKPLNNFRNNTCTRRQAADADQSTLTVHLKLDHFHLPSLVHK